jgi:acyl-CoA reductase-like NAD-dependent aldehyde dehydrogenase
MTGSATSAASTGTTPGATIAGARRPGGSSLPVINPATGRPFTEVPTASKAQLDDAVTAAAAAAAAWGRTPPGQRQEQVLALAAIVSGHIGELARLLTLEQGKPLARAAGEIRSGLSYVESFARMDLEAEVVRDDAGERIVVSRVPVGVVAAITPWNYPLMLALWKIGPALVAGNAVIVKPSPYTPAATLRLGELAQEVLPPGVVQVLAGGDSLGRALTEHGGVGKISFTGSVQTGKAIMASAAGTLKRLTLELGGNDPGIVLEDADPQAIARDLYWAALSNCGQVCAGLKRLYLPAARAGEYAEALAAVAATVVVGDGLTPGTDMGPVQNRPQLDRVRALLADARGRGAEVFFRGQAPDGGGYWHPVTLVRGAGEDAPLVAEEQFGPVLPLLTYDTVDEAIARANATPFGLGASVWSPDEDRAAAAAGSLQAGTVWVNQHPMLSPDTPFGGLKQSGIGVESSHHGLAAYTDISVLRVRRAA